MLPYVRLENEEALDARKSLLASEISILNLVKKINSWKRLRRYELIKKTRLKSEVKRCSTKINLILKEMPEVEGVSKIEFKKIKKEVKETVEERGIEEELQEIREKLEMLNS